MSGYDVLLLLGFVVGTVAALVGMVIGHLLVKMWERRVVKR